jgi:hypothetical protein
MSEQESGFSVVDKRKVKAEAEEGVEAEPAVEAGEDTPLDSRVRGKDDSAGEAAQAEDFESDNLPHLTVMHRMLMCIDTLYQGAWVSLGLVADPATGKVEQDLDSARIAIDSVAFLVDKIESKLDDDTRREVKRVVSDLQMNFVRQSQK